MRYHAGRRAGQLRLGRRRSAGGLPVHRVPHDGARPRSCSRTSTRRRSISSTTTTARSRSRSSCRRACRTCWSTAPPASRSAWPPTFRRTTSARSSRACIALIDDPNLSIAAPDAAHPGPGFPDRRHHQRLAGNRRRLSAPAAAACTCARAPTIEEDDKGRQAIIVTELPYQVNKARLLERIAELVREKVIDGIAGDGLRDESDKDGMRVVIELKRGEVADIVLNNLFKHTPMESVFGINMVALQDGQPKLFNLKEMLEAFVRHRREVVTRRTIYDLRKARERAHILEGQAVALANIDEVIAVIKASPSPAEAKVALMSRAWPAGAVPQMLERAGEVGDAARRSGRRVRAQGGRLSAVRRAGAGHSRPAPEPPDRRWSRTRSSPSSRSCWCRSSDLGDILARPERLLTVIRAELEDIRAKYARQAPHRDHPGSFRPDDRGPDRAAGRRGDAVARRLCEGAAGDGVPGAAARRARQGGDGDEGRGFRRQAVRREYARHAAVLLQRRQDVLAQGLPAAAGEPRLARQADREPAAAAGGRAHQRGAADPRVRREQVRVHGDRAGHGQEDLARSVLAPAPGRHHRHRAGGGRPAGRRRHHRRPPSRSFCARAAARRSASTRTTCGRWAARRPACAASACRQARKSSR